MSEIEKAVRIVGGLTPMARRINVKPPTVCQWLNGERPVPPGRCRAIEEATNGQVTRYDLRPDVFGPAPASQQKAA